MHEINPPNPMQSRDLYSWHDVAEMADETVTGRKHMCGLHRPADQEVTAYHHPRDMISLCLRNDPSPRLPYSVQVLMLEVEVAK